MSMNLIVWRIGRHCGGRYLAETTGFVQSMIVKLSRLGFRGARVSAVNDLLLPEEAQIWPGIDEAFGSSNHCDLPV